MHPHGLQSLSVSPAHKPIAVLLFQLQKQNRKAHKKNNDQLTTLRADLDHHKTTQLQQLTTISETRQQLATVLQKVEQNYQLSITQHKSSLLDQQQNLRNMMQDIRSQLATTLKQQSGLNQPNRSRSSKNSRYTLT